MTPEMLATLTEQVAELVQTYSNNYLQFQRATYNETQVRVDFVNRFFKLLGWDVDNERGLPQHLREVTHEATVVVEEDGVHRSKKPDYSFKVGTEVLYFLETKKPAVNLTIDAETLNIFVQRVLNRTIFLRICEDRCFENYESLKAITTYQDLRTMFAAADQKYDSGLFELLEEDRLTVSDAVIIEIFQSLYYPNNSYEFGVIDPYIIGQIYELFLDEALVIREDGHIETQEKPEVVDSQGAVNTPKNITDIIIEETLRPLYENRTPEEVAQYRIADICCGSGNFLLSAFEYIVNYHIEYYRNHDRENAERRGDIYQLAGSTNYILSYERKRSILKNNIFGVDIDPLAVEVSKFSLLLKALENSSLEEAEAFHQRTNQRILPNLDENIKNGNSLVNMAYARFDRSVYQNVSLMNKLKMFDWNAEFGNRKFDAIIGNPPYIRVQNGYAGFLFLDKNDRPMVALHWEKYMQHIVEKYNKIYRIQMPKVTPHVCRHTFCSNMAKSGMNPKTLQYIMGHSDISVTLNVYTHVQFDDAQAELLRVAEA